MSLFSTLNTGKTALNASQIAIATTSQNISNADNDSYTRQRVSFAASSPLYTQGVSIGSGVSVTSIVRIHDEFVYSKLREASSNLSYDTFSTKTLQETAKYFPDLSDSGLAQDLTNYFTEWSNLASNTTEGSQKIALIQKSVTLTTNIQSTRDSLRSLQDSMNTQLKTAVDELNSIGSQIADLNKQIGIVEATKGASANDLRDQRDKLELTLSKLVNISVFKGNITSDTTVDANMTDTGKEYYLNISGASFVDGPTFHPIVIDNSSNESSYYSISSQMQDGRLYGLTEQLSGGKIGAILDLRGRVIDKSVNGGYPQDGILQGYIDDLDSFAQTFITETNNIYAQSAQKRMDSPSLSLKGNESLKNVYNNMNDGSMDVIVYDTNGKEVARKTLNINGMTTMSDDTFSQSILTQFNSDTDDNHDNNALNDVSDYFKAEFMDNGSFSISPTSLNNGYTVAIKDNGSNFPGIIGVSQFLTGNNASNINVKTEYKENPSALQGYGAPIAGNHSVANSMLQLQYTSLNFYHKDGSISQGTIQGQYSAFTAKIATDASAAKSQYDTNEALNATITSEFQSISGVNKDEELIDLMQYQKSFAAAAKIITTIDQMLDTLLGIKS